MPSRISRGPLLAATSLPRRKFWIELVLSLAVSGGLFILGFAAISTVPVEVSPFLFPLMLFLLLVGPILVFVVGALRRKAGIAVGGMLFLVGIFGYRFVNLQITVQHAEEAVQQASRLDIMPPGRPTATHEIVLIQDSYFGRRDGAQSGCAEICLQILLTSSYAVAIADQQTKSWRVYRKLEGHAACVDSAHIATYLDLLSAGVAETCVAMTRQEPGPDALVIDEDLSHDSSIWKLVPPQVYGVAYEFYERENGVDRLLGRVISGSVQPPILSGQEVRKTSSQMRDFEFYAVALQLPIKERVPYSLQDLTKAVITLETMFRDAGADKEVQEAYRRLSTAIDELSGAEIMKASIRRLWQSEDPELIEVGLATLYRIKKFDVEFAEPFVTAYMASDNTDIMKAAVAALSAYRTDSFSTPAKVEAGLEFAKVPLGNIILSERVAAYGERCGNLVDAMKRVPRPFPEAMRQIALEQLRSRHDLVPDRVLVLLAVVARGDVNTRQAAIDWIFSLHGEPFEFAVTAIGRDADALAAGLNVTFWSDSEMKELVRRAEEVPSDRLTRYIDAIRFQIAFRDNVGQIEDLLDERIGPLKQGSEADRELAAKLETYAQRLAR